MAGTFRGLAMACVLALAACTSVPFDAPKVASRANDLPAPDYTHTSLARQLARHPGKSALVPLSDGNDALGARIRMIETAQSAIDMQYFLLKPDLAGALISIALLEAADRGVRVRFLLDDALTTAKDHQIARLNVHPNIEMRLLNPLSRQSPAVWNYMVAFNRVNRRMHNKSMVVDRSYAIVGGRNIADEYFRVDTSSEFADFDLFLAGPVAEDIGHQFDLYWNDPLAVPLEALHRRTLTQQDFASIEAEIRARESAAEAIGGLYHRATRSTYLRDVREGRIAPVIAPVRVSHDAPDKLKVPVPQGTRVLAEDLLSVMNSARSDVILLTPYFVPQDWGAAFFSDLASRGVRVRIVTNSLASTNHAYVHAGHMRHRKALLAAGVEIYEIRADALRVQPGATGTSPLMTMHTKLAVVDGRDVFVGSLNFDPRSIKINTEFGVFVSDTEIGRALASGLEEVMHDYTYRVTLDENGALAWVYTGADRQEVEHSEPGASGWQKFVANVTRLLPVEGQL